MAYYGFERKLFQSNYDRLQNGKWHFILVFCDASHWLFRRNLHRFIFLSFKPVLERYGVRDVHLGRRHDVSQLRA